MSFKDTAQEVLRQRVEDKAVLSALYRAHIEGVIEEFEAVLSVEFDGGESLYNAIDERVRAIKQELGDK